MTARRLALALALCAGCKRERGHGPPPSQTPVAADVSRVSPPPDDPPWDGAAGATRDEAVSAALGGAHDDTSTVFRELDADGDGRQDALVETRDGCVLARRTRAGWIADAFTLDDTDTLAHCTAPSSVGAEALLTGSFLWTQPDERTRAERRGEVLGLYVARPDERLRRVYKTRFELSDAEGRDWSYDPTPDGTLTMIEHAERTIAGDASTAIDGFMLLRWNAAHNALEQASCWQSARPLSPRDAIPGCTARPAPNSALYRLDAFARDAPLLPPSTLLRVVNADALTRARARLYCVLTPDGAFGHALLADTELTGCPIPIP